MDARIARLKVVACFFVILLHVTAPMVVTFSSNWWLANIYDSVTRICVPLFLMVSGALLLPKREPLPAFLSKRFIRVLPPLFFWSAVYIGWIFYNDGSIREVVANLPFVPAVYHLWYLYAIVGLYALVPLLRIFYQHSSFLERVWVIGLWFLVGSVWPTVSVFLSSPSCTSIGPTPVSSFYQLSVFGGYFGFLLLGAMLADLNVGKKVGGALTVAGSLATIFVVSWQSIRQGSPCDTFYGYQSPFVVIAAAGFFSVFMSFAKSTPSYLLAQVASCTLGIYCLHILFIGGLFPRAGVLVTTSNLWYMAPLISVAAFVVCCAVILLMRLTSFGRSVT